MKTLNALLVVALIAMMALVAGCERKIVNEIANNDQSLNGCFACHGETSFDGALLQARGEWENSFHASGVSIDYTNRPGSDCQQCHNHQGFLDYLATGEEDSLAQSTVSSIHCFTCHAPHERGDLSLRATEPYTLKNGVVFDHGAANLCVNCHHSRTNIANDIAGGDTLRNIPSSRMGPHHGPQGDNLQGTHAFQFGSTAYPSTTHASVVRDACIGCHMGNPAQHDGYDVGGHSFNMQFESHDGTNYTLIGVCTPCHSRYGESGVTKFDDWAPRDVDGDGTVEGIQTEFDNLADSLGVLLTKVINPSTGLFRTNVKVTRGQQGAAYNWKIYEEDRSRGIHNPKFFEAMLKASISHMVANPIP
jgi:hypothetical protein